MKKSVTQIENLISTRNDNVRTNSSLITSILLRVDQIHLLFNAIMSGPSPIRAYSDSLKLNSN